MLKDIEKELKEYIKNYFIDDKMRLRFSTGLLIILFAIITPFHIIYLKIKNIFKKSC